MAALCEISLRVSGHCMTPILNDQDCIQVRRFHKYKIGDILAVRLDTGQLVCHRLIGKYFWKQQMHFLTQPDHGRRPDGAITSNMILGKVIKVNEQPINEASFSFRLQLFLSFLYCLCLRFFAKIGR